MKSPYTEIHEIIDAMLDGTGFSLQENPEITIWSNGPEVKLRIKKYEPGMLGSGERDGVSKQNVQPE